MSIKIKKKKLKILGIIILVIGVIIATVFLTRFILTNIKINNTEKELSQINAEELQTKIIEKLKETPMNINLSYGNQMIITEFVDNYEETNGYVTALILYTKGGNIYNSEGVAIPCFKIESDSNGNFKNIKYIYASFDSIVNEAVERVFKDEYNIDVVITNNARYNSHFRSSGFDNSLKIIRTNEDFLESVVKKITDEDDYDDTSDKMIDNIIAFGLDIK
mgnify:CR=1 FL=1